MLRGAGHRRPAAADGRGKEDTRDAGRLPQAVPRRGQGDGRTGAGGARPARWSRDCWSWCDPGLADQRLHLLPGDAQPGRPSPRRASDPAGHRRGLAGGAVLHRPGAGRAGLVRGADRAAPHRRAGRGVRRGRGGVLPGGDRRADVRDRRDQRLEPARRRAALGRAEPGRPRPARRRRTAPGPGRAAAHDAGADSFGAAGSLDRRWQQLPDLPGRTPSTVRPGCRSA